MPIHINKFEFQIKCSKERERLFYHQKLSWIRDKGVRAGSDLLPSVSRLRIKCHVSSSVSLYLSGFSHIFRGNKVTFHSFKFFFKCGGCMKRDTHKHTHKLNTGRHSKLHTKCLQSGRRGFKMADSW